MKKKTVIEGFIFWIGTTSSIIAHTCFFFAIFLLRFFGISNSDVLLILTTLVSLEAIYLSIFIQMSVNRQAIENQETRQVLSNSLTNLQESIEEVSETIDEVSEKVEEVIED